MRSINLITGATGFTGRALTLELLRRGQRVRALAREKANAQDLKDQGAEICQGDVTNEKDMLQATQGVDVVYHIAALFRTAGHPDRYYHEVNVEGTKNAAEAAIKNGASRFVHCSTVGVHGHVGKSRATEETPFNPGDIYQETKLEGERVIQRMIKEGLPGVVLRPAGIYGPGDLRFLKLFKTIYKGRFVMLGTGETLYHFTYIDDLVDGIILCGAHQKALRETFILCGDEVTTLSNLVKVVSHTVGKSAPKLKLPLWPVRAASWACESVCIPLGIDPPLHKRRVDFFVKDRAFSCEKAKRLLGFRPKTSISDGMGKTAEWYFKQGLLEER